MDTAMVTLEIHICRERRSYLASFSTPQQAVAFIERKSSTHNFSEIKAQPIPEQGWDALLDALYPTCEHGMSEGSCYGPMHFMSAEQEQAMGWQYADAPSGF